MNAETPSGGYDASTASALLARIRERGALHRTLAAAVIDDALGTPLRGLVDPDALAARLTRSVRALAERSDDAARARVAELIGELRERVKADARPIGALLPPGLEAILIRAASHPYTPGPRLVRAVVDHAATRRHLRATLQRSLYDFGRKLGAVLADGGGLPGARLRSRLLSAARGVASAVGAGFESMLEDHVERFVDGTIDRVFDSIVERVSDPRQARESAALRADVARSLLALDGATVRAELDKLRPEALLRDVRDGLERLAAWPALEVELAAGVREELARHGDRTLAELLAGTGLVEAVRPAVEEALAEQITRFCSGQAFATWLEDLMDDTPPADVEPGALAESSGLAAVASDATAELAGARDETTDQAHAGGDAASMLDGEPDDWVLTSGVDEPIAGRTGSATETSAD
ncbi:MAG: hypothetical protein KC636_27600, partial [Myxococcales bacterium]|nr:hypothetical protein [Myxococcales bacterium]